jgi:hypothetical protein
VFWVRKGIKKEAKKMVQSVLQGQGQVDQVPSNATAGDIQTT